MHFLRGRADLSDEADMAELTVGETLIRLLEAHGVDTVFGIPGVHTIELYRGLASSSIRHVTPRHEQGAAFMADGYARASGKPGVAFVITGPGLTNAITPMAQARADSIPMLVISSVNRLETLGKGTKGVDVAAYEQKSYAIFRAFGAERGPSPEAMQDHLKLIPRQVVKIVQDDPHVLDSFDSFAEALIGPK